MIFKVFINASKLSILHFEEFLKWLNQWKYLCALQKLFEGHFIPKFKIQFASIVFHKILDLGINNECFSSCAKTGSHEVS